MTNNSNGSIYCTIVQEIKRRVVMAIIGQQPLRAYGFDGYVNVFPFPIVTNRAPVDGQDSGVNGQVWIDTVGQDSYTMVDTNTSTWINTGGGAGLFTDLDVDPGPVVINSTLTTITGTANVADVIELTTGGAAGVNSTITINNTTGTDAAAIGLFSDLGGISASAAGIIEIASSLNGAGAVTIAADGGVTETVLITSNQGTSAGSITLGSLLGGILLETAAAAKDVTLSSVLGSITLSAGEVAANAIAIGAANGSAQITAGQAVATAIIIEATNAAGGVQIKAGSNGILIGTDGDTAILSMGDVIPTSARTTTLAGGTIGSAIADTVDIAPDGANFAGSSKVVNIATGALVLGTQTVNIASGNVTAAQTQAVNIGTGTGTKTINLGNADGLTNIALNALETTAAGAVVVVNGRTGVGTLTGLTTAAGATETITITNSASTITSGIIVSAAVVGAEDAQMTVQKIRPNAGSITVLIKNNGAAALATDLIVSFMILS
jgi:hypothetical protein